MYIMIILSCITCTVYSALDTLHIRDHRTQITILITNTLGFVLLKNVIFIIGMFLGQYISGRSSVNNAPVISDNLSEEEILNYSGDDKFLVTESGHLYIRDVI